VAGLIRGVENIGGNRRVTCGLRTSYNLNSVDETDMIEKLTQEDIKDLLMGFAAAIELD